MTLLFLGSFGTMILGWLMSFLSVFLILLVLIQRGRGGGLTGALGGPGGQSAFGSKAGDTFTLITVVVAAIWGITCAFTTGLFRTEAVPSVAAETSSLQSGPGDDVESDTFPQTPQIPLGGETLGEGTAAEDDSALMVPAGTEGTAETPASSDSVPLTPADGIEATAGADAPAADASAVDVTATDSPAESPAAEAAPE